MQKNSMQYGTAKKGLLLSAKHRAARVAFARRNSNHGCRSVMFTDSKIFCLHETGAKLWYPKGKGPMQQIPKNTPRSMSTKASY